MNNQILSLIIIIWLFKKINIKIYRKNISKSITVWKWKKKR